MILQDMYELFNVFVAEWEDRLQKMKDATPRIGFNAISQLDENDETDSNEQKAMKLTRVPCFIFKAVYTNLSLNAFFETFLDFSILPLTAVRDWCK